jgi:hypothetical protein
MLHQLVPPFLFPDRSQATVIVPHAGRRLPNISGNHDVEGFSDHHALFYNPSSPLNKSILPSSGSYPLWRRPKSSTNQRIRLWFRPCQTE